MSPPHCHQGMQPTLSLRMFSRKSRRVWYLWRLVSTELLYLLVCECCVSMSNSMVCVYRDCACPVIRRAHSPVSSTAPAKGKRWKDVSKLCQSFVRKLLRKNVRLRPTHFQFISSHSLARPSHFLSPPPWCCSPKRELVRKKPCKTGSSEQTSSLCAERARTPQVDTPTHQSRL